jgi:hypothetical protein
MAYAGICSGQNVETNSDDYFHTHNFDEMIAFRDGGGACGTVSNTGNNSPSVEAGPDFIIPQDTPFTLTAQGDDPDASDLGSLTFNWEQFDRFSGVGERVGLPSSTQTKGPVIRSVPPTSSPSRTIPKMADLLSGVATTWEVLPTVNRDLNFRVTVRDNRSGGGGVDWDDMTITVSGDPFYIISPDSGDTLECGDSEVLTWKKGGSTDSNVSLHFSNNGGSSFSTLVASTPNDESYSFTTPKSLVSNAWLQLQAVGNIYFDLSGPMMITDTLDPALTIPSDLAAECTQDSPPGATPNIGSASANDLCDSSVAVTDNAPSVFPLGYTSVNWTATDDSGNSTTKTQIINVVDTTDPNLTIPPDLVAECSQSNPQGATPDIGMASATDICDSFVSITDDAASVFALGSTTVNWTATDDSGNSKSDTQTVTVSDTTPPDLVIPEDIVKECTSAEGTPVDLGVSTATDICWETVDISNNAPSVYPLGETTVTWQALDDSGNFSTDDQVIKIQDTTPPYLELTVNPQILWSPNHKLVLIEASIITSDVCDTTPAVELVSITSNESDNGLGDGDTPEDIQGVEFGSDDRSFYLRAERSGTGDGRIYTITYRSTDASGNFTEKQATVRVPKRRERSL